MSTQHCNPRGQRRPTRERTSPSVHLVHLVWQRCANTSETQVSSLGFLRGSTAALSVGTIHLPHSAFINCFAVLDTLNSDPVPPDVVQNIRSPSIAIREISARTLLDSGTEGLIIHEDYAKKNKLTLRTSVGEVCFGLV